MTNPESINICDEEAVDVCAVHENSTCVVVSSLDFRVFFFSLVIFSIWIVDSHNFRLHVIELII